MCMHQVMLIVKLKLTLPLKPFLCLTCSQVVTSSGYRESQGSKERKVHRAGMLRMDGLNKQGIHSGNCCLCPKQW